MRCLRLECLSLWQLFRYAYKLEEISHDIYQKTQQSKTPNRTLTEDYQLIWNPQ